MGNQRINVAFIERFQRTVQGGGEDDLAVGVERIGNVCIDLAVEKADFFACPVPVGRCCFFAHHH